ALPKFRLCLRAQQINLQQAIVERSSRHLNPFRQHEATLELSRGNATMQIDALRLVDLLSSNDQLVILNMDRELLGTESGYGKGDAQLVFRKLFDIVRRITLGRGFGDAIEHPLEMIESEQQGIVEERQPGHRFGRSFPKASGPVGKHRWPNKISDPCLAALERHRLGFSRVHQTNR